MNKFFLIFSILALGLSAMAGENDIDYRTCNPVKPTLVYVDESNIQISVEESVEAVCAYVHIDNTCFDLAKERGLMGFFSAYIKSDEAEQGKMVFTTMCSMTDGSTDGLLITSKVTLGVLPEVLTTENIRKFWEENGLILPD